MPTVIMPKMGDAMEEGTLLRWLKQVGDEVAVGDPLAEIETDKVSLEIEATEAGVLSKTYVDEGATVPIGTPIATIGEESAEVAAPARSAWQAAEPERAAAAEPAPAAESPSRWRQPRAVPTGGAAADVPAPAPVEAAPAGATAGSGAAARLAAGEATGRRARHRSLECDRHRPRWAHRARRHRRTAHRRTAHRPCSRPTAPPAPAQPPLRRRQRNARPVGATRWRAARAEQDPAHHGHAHGRVEGRRAALLCHIRSRHGVRRGAARADQRPGAGRRGEGLLQRPHHQGGGAGAAGVPRISTPRSRATSSSSTRTSTSTSRSPSKVG